MLANVEKISGAKRKENLTNHADDARVSKELATAIVDIDFELELDELMAAEMDRSRLREVAREHELRIILERLEEDLGADFVPEASVDETIEVAAEEGSVSDLAKGEVAVAVAGGTWAAADAKKVVTGEEPDLGKLAKELSGRPLIGHDIKSLGGGGQHGLLAACATEDDLDLHHDTMVGAYLLDPARRTYDLIDIAAQRGLATAPDEKDDKAADDGQLALDEEPPPDPAAEARLVFEIAKLQRKSMKEQGLEKLMDEVEMPLVEVLAEMERVGVMLDAERLAEIGKGFEKRIDKLEKDIHKLAGREFTIGSPQQLAEVLFDELGLTKKRRGKTGFSTDARVLGQIRDEHEIIPKIEEWRELTKLKSTYLDALPDLIDPDTGRIHTTFNQTVDRDGPPLQHQPEPPEHPDPQRRGPPDPLLLRRPPRPAPALGRLQPDRAADPRPDRRRGRPARDLRPRRGHPHGDRRRGPGRRSREGQPRRALQGEDGQLRHRLRALGLRALGPPQHRAGGGRRLHRALLRALPRGQDATSRRRSSRPATTAT